MLVLQRGFEELGGQRPELLEQMVVAGAGLDRVVALRAPS